MTFKNLTRRLRQLSLGLLVATLALPSHAELYGGQPWLSHVQRDLAPFWYKAAEKIPDGAFASFLCNDASTPTPQQL